MSLVLCTVFLMESVRWTNFIKYILYSNLLIFPANLTMLSMSHNVTIKESNEKCLVVKAVFHELFIMTLLHLYSIE